MFRERLITIELNQKIFKGLTIQQGNNSFWQREDFAEMQMIPE